MESTYGQKVQLIGHVSKINALFKIRQIVEHYFVEALTRRALFHVILFTILIHMIQSFKFNFYSHLSDLWEIGTLKNASVNGTLSFFWTTHFD
jgi:hypothetical protein